MTKRDIGREILDGIRELKMREALKSAAERVFTVRGKRVILDSDLAKLYCVPTKRLNAKVRRPG